MTCEQITWDVLVASADGELTGVEGQRVSAHIHQCADCQTRLAEVLGLSGQLESFVSHVAIAENPEDRARLAFALAQRDTLTVRQAPARVMRRFGWGMAIAATLAVGILFAPKQPNVVESTGKNAPVAAASANTIEVDGETFIQLPYSNPDLPSIAPRVVQMQVPVSSLAEAGISMDAGAAGDRSVLADVLLGADGQPLGVHVVNWE